MQNNFKSLTDEIDKIYGKVSNACTEASLLQCLKNENQNLKNDNKALQDRINTLLFKSSLEASGNEKKLSSDGDKIDLY